MSETLTMADITDEDVYTPKQIAQVLKVGPRHVMQAFRAGVLLGMELGRSDDLTRRDSEAGANQIQR